MGEYEELIGPLKPSVLEEGTPDKKSLRKSLIERIERVAEAYGMKSAELMQKSRMRKYTEPRRAVMLLVSKEPSITQLEVAAQFG